jgi:hypothetical protein
VSRRLVAQLINLRMLPDSLYLNSNLKFLQLVNEGEVEEVR